ncbi:MAG TPA: hypothetical protein VHE81_04310 [Lacipirellulaceae bacterium]|jgi:hypothetical protein|nr:hypothetical protein [Lacipirellulaceae bacterium]
MLKIIIMTLALGAFAIAGPAGQAQAGHKRCYNMPKSGVPCTIVPQQPLLPQPRQT